MTTFIFAAKNLDRGRKISRMGFMTVEHEVTTQAQGFFVIEEIQNG